MNEITRHESAIWFFIAQKLLFANQHVRKIHKIFKKFQNYKIKNKNFKGQFLFLNLKISKIS